MPRVTVLMCSYQSERFVNEAIASVVAQDFDDWELVVVDDGSTDSTSSILSRWAEREPRIVLVTHAINRGTAQASNRGLAIARGEYVARLDADDVWLPGHLREQVRLLDRNPDVMLVSSAYEVIDWRGRRVGKIMRAAPSAVTQYLLHFSNYIGGNSQVMFRRDAVCALGGYDTAFDLCQDYDLWTRLMRAGQFVVTRTIGMRYRLHGRQASVLRRAQQRKNILRVARRMMSELLDRDVTHDEVEAVASVWLQECRRGSSGSANRVLREAYSRFRSSEENRRLVRIETARRWLRSATVFARRGELIEAARHIALAISWLVEQREAAGLILGEQIEETRAGDLAGAEGGHVRSHDLAVEERRAAGAEMIDEEEQRELRRVG